MPRLENLVRICHRATSQSYSRLEGPQKQAFCGKCFQPARHLFRDAFLFLSLLSCWLSSRLNFAVEWRQNGAQPREALVRRMEPFQELLVLLLVYCVAIPKCQRAQSTPSMEYTLPGWYPNSGGFAIVCEVKVWVWLNHHRAASALRKHPDCPP